MDVLEAKSNTFFAEITYQTPEWEVNDDLAGAMSPGANECGTYSFSVVDDENYLTFCGQFKRDG